MPVTIKQIAEHLGVSAVTVSKGLNNTGKLSPNTRKRITTTAHKLGYRPNAAARAMVSGRFNQVGLLLGLDPTRSHLPRDLLLGLHDELAENQMHLTVTRLPDEKLIDEGFVPMLLKQTAADGLVINYRSGVPASLLKLIRKHAVPSIWIDSNQSTDGVNMDHAAAAVEAAEHLLVLGHTRIAYADHYLADAPGDENARSLHPSIFERRGGYERAMKNAGLAAVRISRVGPDRVELAKAWLDSPDRPTAVVAYVTATAWPIFIAALSLGVRVPQDLSIITFADIDVPGFQMTEMRLPDYEVGKTAIRMLLEKIEHPKRTLPSVRIRATLQQGKTCGPAPR